MEKSLKEAADYKARAQKTIEEAKDQLMRDYLETAVNKAYYGCFYAIHSQMALLGIAAKSHKQVGIEFRRHFIKTKKMDEKYSKALASLFQWRSLVDYTATSVINQEQATKLVTMAADFVKTLLQIK